MPKDQRIACGESCSQAQHCIGYAVDKKLCNIYTDRPVPAPPGWLPVNDEDEAAAAKPDTHASGIVTTDGTLSARCWVRLDTDMLRGDPEDAVGCAVYALHFLLVACIVGTVVVRGVANECLA